MTVKPPSPPNPESDCIRKIVICAEVGYESRYVLLNKMLCFCHDVFLDELRL